MQKRLYAAAAFLLTAAVAVSVWAADRARLVPAQIRAVEAIYFAAMFEQLRAFAVADRLAELFAEGLLPVGRGNAARMLDAYWRDRGGRLSEAERRMVYRRTVGLPGGENAGGTNRDFEKLWLRFLSSVGRYARQQQVEDSAGDGSAPITAEEVRTAGRTLARNLSLHGAGTTFYAASSLQKQIKDAVQLLSDPEITHAYGARDWFEVVEKVAALELGGAGNTARYRSMGAAGATVIEWLADNTERLNRSSFELAAEPSNRPPKRGPQHVDALPNPTDADLVRACEEWLAAVALD
jgi:hypothetical protein